MNHKSWILLPNRYKSIIKYRCLIKKKKGFFLTDFIFKSICLLFLLWKTWLQVAPYKRIRRVMFVDMIPKNAPGKVLRKELIKLALSKATSKL